MARCGCSSQCSCSVQAGTGTTVTGTGTAANPYVINATAAAIVTADSTCIDLSGTGLAGSPLTAAPIIAAGANLLTCTAGGLAVLCEDVQDCVGAAIAAGLGLDYNDAANSMSARLSTDLGNAMSFGVDGGLFVPVGGGATITTLDTPCIDLGGDGSGALPLTATPIIAAGANLLTCTAGGLAVLCEDVQDCVGAAIAAGLGLDYDDGANSMSARLSTDAGNTTVFGVDGGIYTPGGAGVVGLCGLEGAGTLASPLVANVATWAFPCPQTAANATEIFCDPVTGELQGEPPQAMTFDQQFINTTPAPTAVPAGAGAGTIVGPPLSLTVNNPSACRTAYAIEEIEVDADFDMPAGSTAELMIDADVMWRDHNTGASTQQDIHTQGTKVVSASVAIAPGGSLTVTNELRMRGGTGGATYDRTQLTGRLWLITI